MNKKIILAYSGGLDTSVILHWLKSKGYEVVCFIADVGQQEDFNAIEKKAYSTGACKVYIENLQRLFVEDYIFPALKANAVYEGAYLLGTSLARPLIAKKQVEIAHQENTNIFAHGATGKGNDQVRFEFTYYALMPQAEVIAPWRDPQFLAQFQGRDDLIAYAKKHNIPIEATAAKPYSVDENLMHTSFEAGILENPAQIPDESLFKKIVTLDKTPSQPTQLTITFNSGIPTKIFNHETDETVTGSLELFLYLNTLGAQYGVGRVDMVENRFVGIKSRGVYETPAGTILWKAHKDLEALTLDREVAHLKEYFALTIASLIYNGFWESPEMKFLMVGINHSQEQVTGTVTLFLHYGNVFIVGRTSPYSLYQPKLSSMHEAGGYNQADAQGFIKIQAMRLKQTAKQINHAKKRN